MYFLTDPILNDFSLNLISPLQTFSWASVTSKNLPPSGIVPTTGIPPHVVKAPTPQVIVTC